VVDFEEKAPDAALAHPTLDHILPLLFAAGAASPHPGDVRFPVEGYEYGSLSRLSVQFG